MSKEEWLAKRAKLDQEKKQAEDQAAAAAKAKLAATRKSPAVPSKSPPASTAKPSSAPVQAAVPLPTKEAKEPARPADVAEWKRDDYYSARSDNDPRLAAAVVYLGQQFAGKESAAELIGRLIDVLAVDSKEGDDGEDLPKPSLAPDPNLIEAAIGALIANGTPHARQILDQLLSQSLAMNSQVAATIAKTILAHPSPNNEDLLFRMATVPEPESSGDRGAAASRSAQHVSTVELASVASEEFRVRLARHMIAAETSPAVYDRLWGVIKAPRPENLAAQMILYQGSCLDRATQEQMEQWFAQQSGEALTRLFGIRSPAQVGATTSRAAVSTDPLRSVKLFLDPGLSAVVQRRLLMIEDLSKSSQLVTFACTLPIPFVRMALLRALEKHWEEGPKGLKILRDSAGLPVEPGFVALVKMLPRKDCGTANPGAVGGDRENDQDVSKAKSGKLVSLYEARLRHDQTAQQWMDYSRDVVLAACQRLWATARADQVVDTQRELTAADADLPFSTHPNAVLIGAYRLDWPDEPRHKMVEAPPLRIRYARIEQKAQPSRLLAFYRRQCPNAKEHTIPGGNWLDTLEQSKEHSDVRSIDVLITKVAPNIPGLPNQEQELFVDVLVIECDVRVERSSL